MTILNKSRRAITLVAALIVLGPTAVVAAPQYPPSIQQPTAGEPLFAPTSPLKSGIKVIVPIAQANSIPATSSLSPVPAKLFFSSGVSKRVLTPNSFSVNSIGFTRNILLGGVKRNQLNEVPVASFRASRDTEIQVVGDVPTILELRGLTAGASVKVSFSTSSKSWIIGEAKADSSGNLRMPPITISGINTTVLVKASVGSKVYEYTVRATL